MPRKGPTLLLYGDPVQTLDAGDLLARIRAHLASPLTPDTARSILILAGQLEQASADDNHADLSTSITDAAANLFLTCMQPPLKSAMAPSECAPILKSLLSSLDPLAKRTVHTKLPEGFAFYTLYPEQYALAADQWVTQHPLASHTLVLGIRSIGTSLSALVLSTLRARGLTATRLTARPTGHPYDRQLSLPEHLAPNITHALIVDEGPGRSGSSLFAASRALTSIGVPLERQTLLPGHHHPPGLAASPDIQKWYATANRIVIPYHPHLQHQLKQKTADLLHLHPATLTLDDLSAGNWRDFLHTTAPAWPAFERTKWKITAPDGRALLWKFHGLLGGADRAASHLRRLTPWTTPPISTHAGFLATNWIPGRPLEPADLTDNLLHHLAHYINATATLPMPEDERRAALTRLSTMAIQNTRESLGDAAANHLAAVTVHLTPQLLQEPRAAADGRLAPWEWLRTPDGSLLKTDAQNHDEDHTCIGPQPRHWDVASAIVDWQMSPAQQTRFLHLLTTRDPHVAAWYTAAYATFRLAMCQMASTPPSPYLPVLQTALSQL